MKTFTKQFIEENCGCYTRKKLYALSFMQTGSEFISLSEIVESRIPLINKFWFVCRKTATKEENQQIAIECAETVLPLFEKVYPENKALRDAVDAAKLYTAKRISLKRLLLRVKNTAYVTEASEAAVNAMNAANVFYAADAAEATAYTIDLINAANAAETVINAINAAEAATATYAAAYTYAAARAALIAACTIKAKYTDNTARTIKFKYTDNITRAIDIKKQLLQILIDFTK